MNLPFAAVLRARVLVTLITAIECALLRRLRGRSAIRLSESAGAVIDVAAQSRESGRRAVAAAVDVVDEEDVVLELVVVVRVEEVEVVEEDVVEEDVVEEDVLEEDVVDEDVVEEDEVGVVDDKGDVVGADGDAAAVTLYSDKPFGPPQICDLSAAQSILQRPSLTGAEPATRALPQ